VVPAPDAAGAELPPPRPENNDEPDVAVAVVGPLVAVVLAPVEAAVLAPAPEKRLLGAAPEEAGGAMLPPKLKDGAVLDAGCEEAG
jgi:hypothetical protein